MARKTPQKKFLIISSADGTHRSYIVNGLKKLRLAVIEEYYMGTPEEAEEDDVVKHVLARFDNEDEWTHDDYGPWRWDDSGEQCSLEIIRITG